MTKNNIPEEVRIGKEIIAERESGEPGDRYSLVQITLGCMEVENPSLRFLAGNYSQTELELGFSLRRKTEDIKYLEKICKLHCIDCIKNGPDLRGQYTFQTLADIEEGLIGYGI